MNHFVTISTAGHLYKVYALAESLQQQRHEFLLHVLVIDGDGAYSFPNCRFYRIKDIRDNATAKSIIAKYGNSSDKLRWCLKPVVLKYLLESGLTDKIIYLDNDLFFYSDYAFLFDLLGDHSILLTPHYYKANPEAEQNWLEANFRVGLYNAGFVGANKDGLKSLQWWADCCLYRCEKNAFRGIFDDQKYLDLMPILEPSAHVVRHQGCNVAGWNRDLCQRQMIGNELRINGKYPVVFIHFNQFTFREILQGRDVLLTGFCKTYFSTLKKHKPDLAETALYSNPGLTEQLKYRAWKIITQMGW
jgi:hypothetical protein